MADFEHEFPIREDFPSRSDEFSLPDRDSEFGPPGAESEFSPPPQTDYFNPDPDMEFSPPGAAAAAPPQKRRRKRLRRLLYIGAAVLLLWPLFDNPAQSAALPSPTAVQTPLPAVVTPAPVTPSAAPEATPSPVPTAEPAAEPVVKEPVVRADFFYFSHEHHATVYLENIGAIHSVEVSVRDKTLDLPVYDYFLSEEEIASGKYDLPMLSTGDLYMDHWDEYAANDGWPEFELLVTVWYENEAGDGEDTLELTMSPVFELGIGVSYWNYDWDEQLPPDSFVVTPWEETDQISFVINDPDAVTDPTVFSVDFSYNGRHAAPEDYQVIKYRDEYDVTHTGSDEPEHVVAYTSRLLLRRPEWMPESGTVHVTMVQRLASTGELWIREEDVEYPPVYDW